MVVPIVAIFNLESSFGLQAVGQLLLDTGKPIRSHPQTVMTKDGNNGPCIRKKQDKKK